MKRLLYLVIISIVFNFSVSIVNAEVDSLNETDYNVISFTEKYYKTEIHNNNYIMYSSNSSNVITTEISKDEYDKSDMKCNLLSDVTVQTEYKKMTTTILESKSNYRYKVVLAWKNFPKVRSYDIIGISFYKSVKPTGNINFKQDYRLASGAFRTDTSFTSRIEDDGVSAVFKLPSDNVTSLSSTLYFDVTKTDNSTTILKQYVVGDYSHAVKSISLANAQKHNLNLNGIVLDSSITNYYDAISPADLNWSGSW